MGLMSVGGAGLKKWQYTNLVPPLTSTSQDGYKVSASAHYGSQTADSVVMCFDGDTTNVIPGDENWTKKIFMGASNTDLTITVELPAAKELRVLVALYPEPGGYGVGHAEKITVSGSNNGSSYTKLSGVSQPYNIFSRDPSDTIAYKYYKIDMTRSFQYIGITEIFLFGK